MPKVLVTAGPTREHLDDVRFLSNASSGTMGYAVAAAARAAGCEVVLVSGPTNLPPPPGVGRVDVVSALEMLAACQDVFAGCDVMFAVAAVADHRPLARAVGKPSKAERCSLELVANPDIVATLARDKGARVVVGFALAAVDEPAVEQRARALSKLRRKHLDLIVLNDARALGAERSSVTIMDRRGELTELPAQSKQATARWLVDAAFRLRSGA